MIIYYHFFIVIYLFLCYFAIIDYSIWCDKVQKKINQNGQALVEFIVILPIFLLLVMGIFDFGNILYQKYKLENHLDYIVELYKSDVEDDLEAYLDNNEIEMTTRLGDNYSIIELSKKLKIITPGLESIIGDPYVVKTSKVIYDG